MRDPHPGGDRFAETITSSNTQEVGRRWILRRHIRLFPHDLAGWV